MAQIVNHLKSSCFYKSMAVSHKVNPHTTRDIRMFDVNNLEQRRNLLILKGSVPWEGVLGLLDKLLKEASKISGLGYIPKPWQVFSLICASGNKSRGQKSTEECRQIMDLIQSNSSRLSLTPSSWTAYFGSQMVKNALVKHCDEPNKVKYRSEVFVWSHHRADEPTNYITSYNYDITKQDTPDLSVSDLFFRAFSAREFPDGIQETIKYPFHGLVQSAQRAKEYHNSLICISFREPARDASENESEVNELQKMEVKFHYPFVFPSSEGNVVPNDRNDIMLKAAAEKLAEWLKEGSKKMLEADALLSLNRKTVDMV